MYLQQYIAPQGISAKSLNHLELSELDNWSTILKGLLGCPFMRLANRILNLNRAQLSLRFYMGYEKKTSNSEKIYHGHNKYPFLRMDMTHTMCRW